MKEINCYIPIKLRITGRLSETQLEGLGETLARTVAARIAFAQRTIAAHLPRLRRGGAELVREEHDPLREDITASEYSLPSYDRTGEKARVQLKKRRGPPWVIRRAINFRAHVGRFLDVIESWAAIPERDLYSGLEHELRWVSVWSVEINRELMFLQFFDVLYRRARELSRVRPNQGLYAVAAVHEDLRQQLIDIDGSGVVAREIPVIEQAGRVKSEGQDARMRPGARVLFASIVVPKPALAEQAELGAEIEVPVRLRDLTFLVAKLFEDRFKLSWDAYVREFGYNPATVHLQPVTVRRRTHFAALEHLVGQTVSQRIGSIPAFSGREHLLYARFYVLTNATLQQWPQAVRERGNDISNDETRRLNNAQVSANLEPNWKAAHVYSVVTITQKSVEVARYRPGAAGRADALIALMRERLVTARERGAFTDFVKGSYPRAFPIIFEVLLDELKRRENGKWFDRLFQATQEAKDYELRMLVIALTKESKYANDPQVLALLRHHHGVHESVLSNEYEVEENKITLEKLFGDKTVSVGDVLHDIHAPYFYEEKAYKPKSKYLSIWDAELQREALELIGRIERGEDQKASTSGYTEVEFADAVLKAVFSRIGITEDNFGNYFDTVTIRYSVRFLGLKKKTDALGLETVKVVYRVVASEEGGEWKEIGDLLEATDTEFDYMIERWVHGHVSAIIITMAKGAAAIAAFAVAWHFRIIQTLTSLAGGAKVVIPSIILSTIFEVIVNGFTFESFLLGAINGYLGALFFRGAGLLARGFFGRSITTASFREGLLRWIGVQAFKGSLAGGTSGAAIRFTHDVYLVATGRGKWSSPADYAKSIGLGAAIGVGVELAGPIFIAPVLESAMGSAIGVVKLLRANGISPARWQAWSGDAYAKVAQRLGGLLERQPGRAATITDGFRILYEQVTKAYASLGRGISGRVQLSVFRQTFELAKAPLSRSANQGLKKLLTAAEGDPSRASKVFNALADDPQQAVAFLELVNGLEQASVRRVLNALGASSASDIQAVVRSWLQSGAARESLDEFLERVWTNRQRVLQGDSGDVYDLYAEALETNPLTRAPGAYLEEIGQIITQRPPGTLSNIQGNPFTGFHRFERTGADLRAVQERIYLNVKADRAPEVMRFVVRDIVDNPSQFPGIGMAKLTGPGGVSGRPDAIVIYAENQVAVQNALERIRSYHTANPAHFQTTTPPMTNRVMEGVSVGAEPIGHRGASFGTLRSDATYDALEQAISSNETFQGFKQRVFKIFQQRGINPVAPQLNLPAEPAP